jgi:hypothetical protein
MGTFTYPLEFISANGTRAETVNATVDTGSTGACLPADLLREIDIISTTASGQIWPMGD